MTSPTEPYWTDAIFGLTLSAGNWLSLWSTFLGVIIAFLIGAWWQRRTDRMRIRSADEFLTHQLKKCLICFDPFDQDFRPIRDEPLLEKAFGALSQADASVRWAIAHPEHFKASTYTRLLLVRQRLEEAAKLSPSTFARIEDGELVMDQVAASTELWKAIRPVAGDIRYLLGES